MVRYENWKYEDCKDHGLTLMSTSFEYKQIHKGFWIAPDGKIYNKIDHALFEDMH